MILDWERPPAPKTEMAAFGMEYAYIFNTIGGGCTLKRGIV